MRRRAPRQNSTIGAQLHAGRVSEFRESRAGFLTFGSSGGFRQYNYASTPIIFLAMRLVAASATPAASF